MEDQNVNLQDAEHFRLLMENVTDYTIFTLDPEGRISSWNEGAERILGYQAEEIIGHLADVIFTPEDRALSVVEKELRRAEEAGRAEDKRWDLKKDGSRFWASGILSVLRNEAGNLRGYVKILRDLTVQKRLEDARIADQERFLEQERQAAVLQERNRIGQELHDTLAQSFVAITLHLDSARETFTEAPEESEAHLARAQELARESGVETRRAVRGLRPHELEHHTLVEALSLLVEQARAATNADVALHVEGGERGLPANVEDELLRIGQEVLTNAIKHARATTITLTLTYATEQVRLEVADNGIGFDTKVVSVGSGFGQTSMRERAERIGGRLEVSSEPGAGTRVSLTVQPTLPQKRAWLLVALTSMADAVIATDTEGRVTYLNPAAETLTGWSQREAVGKDVASVYNVVDEETSEAIQRLLVDIARGGEVVKVTADILLIAKSGKETPVQDTTAPLQDVGGHTIGVVVVFHDDTEKREQRHQLETMLARMRERLAETHHRVKNHFQIAAALVEVGGSAGVETGPTGTLQKIRAAHPDPGAHPRPHDRGSQDQRRSG